MNIENNIEIIDNFISEEDFNSINNFLLQSNGNFPWYYNSHTVDETGETNKLYDIQFNHMFYNNGVSNSGYFEILRPILNKLNPAAILRIKANLTPSFGEHYMDEEFWHLDFHSNVDKNTSAFNGKTAIFYVNTNNGYTKFKDGTKVNSVANRIVIFNSNLIHMAVNSTDTKVRCNINFNYFEWGNQ